MRGKKISQKESMKNFEELRNLEIDRLGSEEIRQISHDDWLDEIGFDPRERDTGLESELSEWGDEVSSRSPAVDSTPSQNGGTEVKKNRGAELEKDGEKEAINLGGNIEELEIRDDIEDDGTSNTMDDGDETREMITRAKVRLDRVSTGKNDNLLRKTLTRLRSVKDEMCDSPYCPLSYNSSSPLRFEACDIATTAYAAFTPPHAYFVTRRTFEDDTQPYTSTSSGDEWGTGRNDEMNEEQEQRSRDMKRIIQGTNENGYTDNHKSFDDDNSEEDESDSESTEDDDEADVGVHIGDGKKYFNCHGCGRRCNVELNRKNLRKINEEEKDKEKDEYYSSFFVSSFSNDY